MAEKSVSLIVLSDGTKILQLGLRTYHLAEGDESYNSVLTTLKTGYRHIDIARAYQNERSVGKTIKDSGIPRDQIWLTSKLWSNELKKEKH
ncbi:MAG: aldo/keto reductase [Alphaproteobacteria bacterium]|nr:aldo/keto reductase [Alphaproteobacteria bacterium]